MLVLEDARARLIESLTPLSTETVRLADASARFLAGDVSAGIDLPPFDNSAMDGYAVRSAETAAARADCPVVLRVVGEVPAGRVFATTVQPGECVRLYTGSPIPAGADAVVMQEDVRLPEDASGFVHLLEPVRPWEDVRFRGEDVKAGSRLAAKGDRIRMGSLSLLAACGIEEVSVHRRPRVAILVTGSELQAPGKPLAAGQIYESNSVGLAELIRQAGGIPQIASPVPDDPSATGQALAEAFGASDLVLTAGGASVGEHDCVRAALISLGGTVEFWRLAMKPGKPFFHGRLGGKALLGLPGNPVSALVTALLLVAPAVRRLQGAGRCDPPGLVVLLGEALANRDSRRHFVRVRFQADGRVCRAGVQASHILSSMAVADGLIDVPPGSTLAEGTFATLLPFSQGE